MKGGRGRLGVESQSAQSWRADLQGVGGLPEDFGFCLLL